MWALGWVVVTVRASRSTDSTVSMRIRVRRRISRSGLRMWVSPMLAAAAEGSIGTNKR